jgi:hypothetical protein
VRVEDRLARGASGVLVEQAGEALAHLRELGALLVEDAGDRAPARPPPQELALTCGRLAARLAQGREDLERVEVAAFPRATARRRDRLGRRRPCAGRRAAQAGLLCSAW